MALGNVKTLYSDHAPAEAVLPYLTEVLNDRGYLVANTNKRLRSGDIIPLGDTYLPPGSHRVYVLEETDLADYESQWAGLFTKGFILKMRPTLFGTRFYRVSTD